MATDTILKFTDPTKPSFLIRPFTLDGPSTPISSIQNPNGTTSNTSLKIPGKGIGEYGQYINSNVLSLLENFASPSKPKFPLTGQDWFLTVNYWHNSTGAIWWSWDDVSLLWINITGLVTVGPIAPLAPNNLDLWFNSGTSQLNIYVTAQAEWIIRNYSSHLGNPVIGDFPEKVTLQCYSKDTLTSRQWIRKNNVFASSYEPLNIHRTNGDLWLDNLTTPNAQLRIYDTGTWKSVAENYLPLAGGIMTGNFDMGGNIITNSGSPVLNDDLANKLYVDNATAIAQATVNGKVNKVGDIMTGELLIDTSVVSINPLSTSLNAVPTREYVDAIADIFITTATTTVSIAVPSIIGTGGVYIVGTHTAWVFINGIKQRASKRGSKRVTFSANISKSKDTGLAWGRIIMATQSGAIKYFTLEGNRTALFPIGATVNAVNVGVNSGNYIVNAAPVFDLGSGNTFVYINAVALINAVYVSTTARLGRIYNLNYTVDGGPLTATVIYGHQTRTFGELLDHFIAASVIPGTGTRFVQTLDGTFSLFVTSDTTGVASNVDITDGAIPYFGSMPEFAGFGSSLSGNVGDYDEVGPAGVASSIIFLNTVPALLSPMETMFIR